MKIVRKQIGIKIGIDEETGHPSIEPLFETKIQGPTFRTVISENYFYYICLLWLLWYGLIQKDANNYFWFLFGIATTICIRKTLNTINENS